MESYWSHYGIFNHFQLEKNEFGVVLMEFCYHLMVTLWSFCLTGCPVKQSDASCGS